MNMIEGMQHGILAYIYICLVEASPTRASDRHLSKNIFMHMGGKCML
jgi:hypothetical protein